MPILQPKTIMISGATSGIGRALALAYSEQNRTLILTGRDAKRLESIAEECQEKGSNVIFKAFDITDQTLLADWLCQLIKLMAIDLVIANAGITSTANAEGYESLEVTHQLLAVNLHAVINMIHPIVQDMRQRKCGQVAIMSSLAAFRGLPQSPAYCASKAAIKAYGESLRSLLKKDGITVSIICPGFVNTAMTNKAVGPKPFILSAQKAARIVKRRLAKGSCQITFPFQLLLALKFLNMLPKKLADDLLAKR
jgi:short-subunit dehydrogenase